MNYELYTYNIPSNVTFFEGKVEREIAFVYGLEILDNGNARLIKVQAGTYKNLVFTPSINFIKNNQNIDVFTNNYLERNTYKETCKLYAIINKDGAGYNKTISAYMTDKNAWTFWFSKSTADLFIKNNNLLNVSIVEQIVPIKSLLDNGVVFSQEGISNFTYDELTLFPSNGQVYSKDTISLLSGSDGTKVFNAYIQDNVGYTMVLDCTSQMNTIVRIPACKFNHSFVSKALSSMPFYNFNAYKGVKCSEPCTDIFNLVYPESNATKNGVYQIFTIQNNNNLFYNHQLKQFVSLKNQATWYFSKNNASIELTNALNIDGTANINDNYKIAIKHLVAYGINFPCSSFIAENINDYITEI